MKLIPTTSLVQSECFQEDSQCLEHLAIQRQNLNLEEAIQMLWPVSQILNNLKFQKIMTLSF